MDNEIKQLPIIIKEETNKRYIEVPEAEYYISTWIGAGILFFWLGVFTSDWVLFTLKSILDRIMSW